MKKNSVREKFQFGTKIRVFMGEVYEKNIKIEIAQFHRQIHPYAILSIHEKTMILCKRGWSNQIMYPFDSMADASLLFISWCALHSPSVHIGIKECSETRTKNQHNAIIFVSFQQKQFPSYSFRISSLFYITLHFRFFNSDIHPRHAYVHKKWKKCFGICDHTVTSIRYFLSSKVLIIFALHYSHAKFSKASSSQIFFLNTSSISWNIFVCFPLSVDLNEFHTFVPKYSYSLLSR